jgi:hypothetical protein
MVDGRRALSGLPVPGRTPLRAYVRRDAARIKQAIRRGRPVVLAISYLAWNRTTEKRTGDPRFIGAHSVLVFGERRRGHGVEWRLFDPLEDGRREGIERGPTWRRRRDVMAAALALVGGDRGAMWALVVAGANER